MENVRLGGGGVFVRGKDGDAPSVGLGKHHRRSKQHCVRVVRDHDIKHLNAGEVAEFGFCLARCTPALESKAGGHLAELALVDDRGRRVDLLSSLELGTQGTVKDKDGENRSGEESKELVEEDLERVDLVVHLADEVDRDEPDTGRSEKTICQLRAQRSGREGGHTP